MNLPTIIHSRGCALNASIGSAEALEFIRQHGPADVMYSDPPWGNANIKYFMKKAPQWPAMSQRDFFNRLKEIVGSHVRRRAFILYNVKDGYRLAKFLEEAGLGVVQTIAVRTPLTDKNEGKSTIQALLISVTKAGVAALTEAQMASIGSKVNYGILHECLRVSDGHSRVFLDGCAGFGRYLREALADGWKVIGVEINPTRFTSLKCKITGEPVPAEIAKHEARC